MPTSMQVQITTRMDLIAKYAQATLDALLPDNTQNPSGISQPDRWYLGAIGEAGLMELLAENGKRAYWAPRFDGKADHFDLRVWIDGEPRLIDVKTAGHERANKIIMPSSQHAQKTHIDYFVGCHKWGAMLDFMGFCRHDEFNEIKAGNSGMKVDTMARDWRKLTSMNIFLQLIDDGNADVDLPPELLALIKLELGIA